MERGGVGSGAADAAGAEVGDPPVHERPVGLIADVQHPPRRAERVDLPQHRFRDHHPAGIVGRDGDDGARAGRDGRRQRLRVGHRAGLDPHGHAARQAHRHRVVEIGGQGQDHFAARIADHLGQDREGHVAARGHQGLGPVQVQAVVDAELAGDRLQQLGVAPGAAIAIQRGAGELQGLPHRPAHRLRWRPIHHPLGQRQGVGPKAKPLPQPGDHRIANSLQARGRTKRTTHGRAGGGQALP